MHFETSSTQIGTMRSSVEEVTSCRDSTMFDLDAPSVRSIETCIGSVSAVDDETKPSDEATALSVSTGLG